MTSSQPPIFYINLDTRPDRRAFMEGQFARLGLTAQRIEAATPADVPPEVIEHGTGRSNPWPMTSGELAVSYSHRRFWEALIASGQPSALVLEDDTVLHPTLPALLSSGPLRRCDTGLLRLETTGNPVHVGTHGVRLTEGLTAHRLLGNTYGSAAYMLNAALAARMLRDPRWNRVEIDRYLFGRGGPHLFASRVKQVVPAPCIQLNFVEPGGTARSDVIAGRIEREARPLGRIARLRRDATLIPYVANLGARLLLDPTALRRGRHPTPAAQR